MATALSTRELRERSRPHLETAPIRIKGILAATDLSPQAAWALKIGARLAKQVKGRLHVLHSVSPQLYLADAGILTAKVVQD